MPVRNTVSGKILSSAAPVADEIETALLRHRSRKAHSASGLILGLEKYRQLRARTADLQAGYQGISIVIDARQPQRVSVF